MFIVVREIRVEEVRIDVTRGGGIEGEGIEVEVDKIDVGGIEVDGIVVERTEVDGIKVEGIGEGAENQDGKMRPLLERRGFLGEKDNSEKLEETFKEEEEDLDKTFSVEVTCVKAYLKRNEVIKL